MVRPHTRTPTPSAAIHEPFHRSVTRLLFSVTPLGSSPRDRDPEHPLSSSAVAAAIPVEPAIRRRFGEPARTDGTFQETVWQRTEPYSRELRRTGQGARSAGRGAPPRRRVPERLGQRQRKGD